MYPNVLRRYLGTLLDFGVIWLVMFMVSRSPYAPQSVSFTLALVGALLFLYEPLLYGLPVDFGSNRYAHAR